MQGAFSVIEYRGLWLPDGEEHLIGWMNKINRVVNGKPSYQYHKYERALLHTAGRRVAVDVGAHCGLMSMQFVDHFDYVEAFEPVAAHRECFERNVPPGNVRLHACALGEREGSVAIHTSPTSSGDSWVNGSGAIPLRTLDSFNLERVDFIKIDCEGYELFVLRGAEKTLTRWKPCVMVEQKPGHAQRFKIGERDAVAYLESLGARLRAEISGDFIMNWA
jgi:FkbM family methyltransferase